MNKLIRPITGILIAGTIAFFTLSGGAQAQMLDVEEAIANTASLLESQSTDPLLRMRLVKLYFVQGANKLKANDRAMSSMAFQNAVRTAFEGSSTIPSSDEVVVLARYGLAHTAMDQGMVYDSITALERMLEGDPENWFGRYMLGILLMGTTSDAEFERGSILVGGLWDETPMSRQTMISETVAQLTFAKAMALADEGRTDDALELLLVLRFNFGAEPSESSMENLSIQYAVGWLRAKLDDKYGALAEYEGILMANPNFEVPNGQTIKALLADIQ